jgi:dienelactone hydrolase
MNQVSRLLAAVILAAGIAWGTTARGEAASTVAFRSSTYNDFRQLIAGTPYREVVVRARLALPDEAGQSHPAVIVVHGLGGYRDAHEGAIAAELRSAGFATLTYDSFAARGTTGAALSATPGYLPIGVADAYAALRLLSRDPRIDGARIAIIGFSFGGDVAHITAFEAVRAALGSDAPRFAAHVAFYPGGNFGAVAAPRTYTGAPVLMLLGGSDDNLPVG